MGIDETQVTALRLVGVVLSGRQAIHARPRCHRMVVHAEMAVAASDMEPCIGGDAQPAHRGEVVAIKFADRTHQIAKAELAELGDTGLEPVEQVEVTRTIARCAPYTDSD